MKKIETHGSLIIQDLETLKVLADPLRAQIVDLIRSDPLTVKEIAGRLGLSPSKLYYHVNLLEKHDLIRVVETRQIANMIERLYQASAEKIDIDPMLLSSTTTEGQENILTVLRSTLDATREDILRSMEARFFELDQGAAPHPRRAIINRVVSRIPEAQAEAFCERLIALVHEFEEADREWSGVVQDLHPYALTVLMYPSFYYEGEDGEKVFE